MATRSEPATARKLQRARGSGDTPSSWHLTQAVTLGAGLCILPSMFAALWWRAGDQLRAAFRSSTADGRSLEPAVQSALIDLVRLTLPLLAVVAFAQLASKLVQNGSGRKGSATSSGYRSRFRLGLGRLFTGTALLAQAGALVIAVILVLHSLLWTRDHAVAMAATLGDIPAGARLIGVMMRRHLWFAVTVWACVGGIELTLAYRLWLRRQLMSPDEKRQEQKETEGDPLVLWQRARIRTQVLAESSNWSISDATLVIRDQMRIAAVLHYDQASTFAPRLLGVGTSELARAVIGEAQLLSIPIVEDGIIARTLAGCDVGEPIPEKLYEPVAELMSESR